LNFDTLVDTYGGGIRFKSKRRVAFRMDVGSGDEGTFVYFNFGYA
jgi:hypothetical protein